MECFAVQHPIKNIKKLKLDTLVEQFNFAEPVYLFKDQSKLDEALNHNFLNATEKQRYVVYSVDVKGTFTTAKIKLPNNKTLGGRKGRVYHVIPADMAHFELKSAYDWSSPETVFEFSPKNEQTVAQKRSGYIKPRKINKLTEPSREVAQCIVDKVNKADDVVPEELLDLAKNMTQEDPIARAEIIRLKTEKTPKINRIAPLEQLASNDSQLNSSYSFKVQAAFVGASVGLTAATLWLVGGVPVLSSAVSAMGLPSAMALNFAVTLMASGFLVALAIGTWKLSSKLYQQIQSASHEPTIDQTESLSTSRHEQCSRLHLQLSGREHSESWRLVNEASGAPVKSFCIGYDSQQLIQKSNSKNIVCLNTERAARRPSKVR